MALEVSADCQQRLLQRLRHVACDLRQGFSVSLKWALQALQVLDAVVAGCQAL